MVKFMLNQLLKKKLLRQLADETMNGYPCERLKRRPKLYGIAKRYKNMHGLLG